MLSSECFCWFGIIASLFDKRVTMATYRSFECISSHRQGLCVGLRAEFRYIVSLKREITFMQSDAHQCFGLFSFLFVCVMSVRGLVGIIGPLFSFPFSHPLLNFMSALPIYVWKVIDLCYWSSFKCCHSSCVIAAWLFRGALTYLVCFPRLVDGILLGHSRCSPWAAYLDFPLFSV